MSDGLDYSPILSLPNELLVKIFLSFVDGGSKPATLARVCRLWRELAHSTHCLWTAINLDNTQEAKRHVQLARNANLQVTWFDRHQGISKSDTLGWIWSRAAHFSHLSLLIPARLVTHVFACMGSDLPELVDLTVIAHDLYFPSVLSPRMAKLRNLHLSSFQISAAYLISMLRDSPLLEVVQFVRLSLPVLAPTPPEPFLLAHLKTFSMAEMFHDSQDYILSRVGLPSACKLAIMGYAQRHNHRKLLHSSTISLLAPIRFTSVSLRNRSLDYDESPGNSRCSLSMRISTPPGQPADANVIIDPTASLDLSCVTTLHLFDARYGSEGERDVAFVLSVLVRYIRTLVFHREVIPTRGFDGGSWLNRILTDDCQRLETIVFDDINLTSASRGFAVVDIVSRFAKKQQARGQKRPRVVLHSCQTDEEELKKLRIHAVEVDVVPQGT